MYSNGFIKIRVYLHYSLNAFLSYIRLTAVSNFYSVQRGTPNPVDGNAGFVGFIIHIYLCSQFFPNVFEIDTS